MTLLRRRRETRALSIGLLARDALLQNNAATVFATFERSFYLDTGTTLIAITTPNLPKGPLNAAAFTVDLEPVRGQRWRLSSESLESDEGQVIDLAQAEIWAPPSPGPADRSTLEAGLQSLQAALASTTLPADGLARLTLSDVEPSNPIEKAAAPAIGKLETILRDAFQGSPPTDLSPVKSLLGLGPGLTPSGDDLLGGILITCHHLGETAACDYLAAAISRDATERTNRISQAHLQAAIRGYGAAPLHDLLHQVSTKSQPGPGRTLDGIAKIGHSSGFDALGGITLALRCYLGSTPPDPTSRHQGQT